MSAAADAPSPRAGARPELRDQEIKLSTAARLHPEFQPRD
jgi:hypothetical protein